MYVSAIMRNRSGADNAFYELSPLNTATTRFRCLSQDSQGVKSEPAGKERNTLIAIVHAC